MEVVESPSFVVFNSSLHKHLSEMSQLHISCLRTGMDWDDLSRSFPANLLFLPSNDFTTREPVPSNLAAVG